MIKVSVIVPVYNVEDYLVECLESLVSQTLKEIEIICVNDGSTDGSMAILEDYKKKYPAIKVFTKPNGGLSDARNFGLKHATGEYIAFVDSDDYVHVNMLKVLYEAMIDAQADLCVSQIKEVYQTEKKDLIDHNEIYPMLGHPTVWNKLYKHEWIKMFDIEFPVGLWYEDNVFTYKYLLNQPKIVYVEDFLYYYRKERVGSIMSSQVSPKIYDIYEVGNQLAAYGKTRSLTTFERQQFELYFIRGIFFRHLPKIIKLEGKHPWHLYQKLRQHHAYLMSYYPNWINNPLFLEDKDRYFTDKLGKHFILKIKILKVLLNLGVRRSN